MDAALVGRDIKPQNRSISANRELQIIPKHTLALSPFALQAVTETPLSAGLHLHARSLCSRSCTAGLENGGGVRGGGNPPSAAWRLGLQRKLRPPALHRKQS